jgi:hypothetical protein
MNWCGDARLPGPGLPFLFSIWCFGRGSYIEGNYHESSIDKGPGMKMFQQFQ